MICIFVFSCTEEQPDHGTDVITPRNIVHYSFCLISALLHSVDPPNRTSPSSVTNATPGVAPSISSSRVLFTPPFVSTGVEATPGADDAGSRLLVFADTLRRAGGFDFVATFPFGDLGACGEGAVIPGIAA